MRRLLPLLLLLPLGGCAISYEDSGRSDAITAPGRLREDELPTEEALKSGAQQDTKGQPVTEHHAEGGHE